MHPALSKRFSVLLPLLFVSACGGGGGGSSDDSPNSPSNRAPEFVSVSEIASEENNTDTLLTLSASDADGDTISFSIIGGEDQSRFLIDNGNQLRFGFKPDFENPTDSDGDNVYQLEVQASDGKGGKTSQSFLVTVANINDGAPAFSSSDQVTVPEGVRGFFYTAAAQDPDKDKVTYSLGGGGADAGFIINVETGELGFMEVPDFEHPADSDRDNHYHVNITAADSEGAKNQLALEVIVADVVTPSVRIEFPTGNSNMGGKMSSVSLTARPVDLESGAGTSAQLASITVDGQSPTQDANSSSLWHLDTSLSEGWDTYPLSAQFVTGETADESRRVNNEQLLEWPIGVSYDSFHKTRYFADTALDAIFEVGSSRRVISGPTVGSGPALNPIDMELNFPLVRSNPDNDYFVVLNSDGSIFSVQRNTGDRTQLTTWIPADLNALSLTPSGNEAYTTRATGSYGEIIKFDLTSGDYAVVSSSSDISPVGNGPDLQTPNGIQLDYENQLLYVTDERSDSVLKIDIATGDRSTISGNGVGSGDLLTQAMDLVADYDAGRIYVANGGGHNIVEVDMASGDQSVITDWTKGAGLRLVNPWSISRDADSDRLLVSDVDFDPALISVDIGTGNRSDISSNHVGTGPSFTWSQLDYDASSNTLYAVSTSGPSSTPSVVAIDLENGNRQIISDPDTGDGISITLPTEIQVDGVEQRAFVFDNDPGWLVQVDLVNGNREVISSVLHGSGATVGHAGAMALDLAGNRIALLDSWSNNLITVDLDTGDREIISGPDNGTGPNFDSPNGLALDIANGRAFVSNYGNGSITQVDLANGNRTTLVASVDGGSIDEQSPDDLAFDPNGNRLLVGTSDGNLVAIDLEDNSQSTLSNGRDCDSLIPADCHGVPMSSFSSMAIDPESNRLFAHDGGLDGLAGIVVVDLRSGQRALASK